MRPHQWTDWSSLSSDGGGAGRPSRNALLGESKACRGVWSLDCRKEQCWRRELERESLTHTPSTNRAPSEEAPKSQEPSEPQGSQGFSHISACHIHSLRNKLQLLFLEKQNPSSPGCTLGPHLWAHSLGAWPSLQDDGGGISLQLILTSIPASD